MFGLTADEVEQARSGYDPVSIIRQDEDLSRVIGLLEAGLFNSDEPGIFDAIVEAIKSPTDPWMTAADFSSYVAAQRKASETFRDEALWTRMSILNTAAAGKFSSDRTILEYNQEIWKLHSVVVPGV